MIHRRGSVARMAAIALATLATTVAAQPSKRVWLVQVIDSSGAVVQGARVQVGGSTSQSDGTATTDRDGLATLEVIPGTYILTVTANGFERWSEQIEERSTSNAPIVARLKVASGGGVGILAGPEIPLDHIPIDASIPFQSLENLCGLNVPIPRRQHGRRQASNASPKP